MALPLTGSEPITVRTTSKGEKVLEDFLDGETLEVPINLFEEALLKYIHNGPNHQMSWTQPLRQVGTEGLSCLNYLADNDLIRVLRAGTRTTGD